MSKLSDADVMEIIGEVQVHNAVRELRHEYSYEEIGKRYGVSRNYVWMIANGMARKELTLPLELRGEL